MKKELRVERLPCTFTATRRACRSITQLYDLVLAPLRLKSTQFIILRAISENGEIAQCELSREYGVSIETLSRRLASMRNAGWLQLRIGGERQEHIYRLTPEGTRLLEEAARFWQRADDRLAEAHAALEGGGLAELVAMLDRLTKTAQLGLELRTSNHAEKRAAGAA